jgi:hypothetical protein
LLASVGVAVAMIDARADGNVPSDGALQAAMGSPAHCVATLEALNRRRAAPSAADLRDIGVQFDRGECLVQDAATAAQFYAEAARRGSVPAAQRLAALFGTGRGLPQSYANAGAWLVGKGNSQERIEPWDYSVGLAFTVIAAALEQVRFPADLWPVDMEVQLALGADSRLPGRVEWRLVGDETPRQAAVRAALGQAIESATVTASARMAKPLSQYVVPARVTLPITVRRTGAATFTVTEQDAILR